MSSETVGVIGLGIMGSAMSANLMRTGFQVVGYDVVPQRLREHKKSGGATARSCREVSKRSSIVITSLPSAAALLETAAELAKARRSSRIIIETSTLPIPVKEEARRRLARCGATLLDCPLSGTGAQARTKDLVVYASGDPKACLRAAPVFDGFSRAHHYVGAFGAGSKMKFVANLLVAIHNVAAAEAMVLAMKSGLDPALVLRVISDGAGNSRMFEVRGPMMVKGDYADAMMKLQVWQKDMSVIGDFAQKLECPTPLFSASAPIYMTAMAMGRHAEDTAAVCAVLEEMAHYSRRTRRGKTKRMK